MPSDRRLLGVLPGGALLASVLLSAPASAAVIQVNTTEDLASGGGKCSLREAVIAANTNAVPSGSDCIAGTGGGNTIELPKDEYKLTIEKTVGDDASSGDLNITAPVTISGSGSTTTKIEQIKADRVFHVESAGVQISNVAIAKGSVPAGNGGGILVGPVDTLTLASSIVSANEAESGAGISVSVSGEATVENSTVGENHASVRGGGIDDEGTATVEDAKIEDNKAKFLGGGIFIESNATTVLSGGEIAGNEAPGENGGGIFSFGSLTATGANIKDNSSMEGGGVGLDAPATLTDDKVTGNLAEGVGGGIYTDESLTLTNSSVAENRLTAPESTGGGIAFEGTRESVLDIEGSTIGPSNFAADGDGVFLFGESAIAKLTRSTIAENGAINSERGGGLYVRDGVETILHDVTLAENSAGTHGSEGGNVYAEAGSKLTWENSLVADDLSGGNCLVNGSTLTSLGGNEEYATGTECHFTNARDTKGPELEPAQLLPLAHNGGPTETMALTQGSPPVNTGFGCEATDQRGVPRPQGPACDAGAYELVTTPLVVTIFSGPSGTVTTPDVSFSFSAEKPSTFQCELDGGVFEPCSSPFTAGPLAPGAHNFTVQATDTADNMGPVSASRTFTIVAPGAGSNAGSSANNGSSNANLSANNGSSNASSSATKGPVVSGLAQSAARWREGAPLPHISRARARPPLGTTFSFNLNEQAAVRFSFTQRLNGRELGHRCLGRSKKNFKRKSCLRTVTVGTISFTGHLGTNKVFFQGRLSRSKKLQPGRYTVTVNATDAAGGRSAPVSLRFTVVNG